MSVKIVLLKKAETRNQHSDIVGGQDLVVHILQFLRNNIRITAPILEQVKKCHQCEIQFCKF